MGQSIPERRVCQSTSRYVHQCAMRNDYAFSDDLLAVLNSRLGDWYIRQLGVTRNGGYFEYKPMFVEQLPVPKPLKQISSDADIYELYGLTESEISFIEKEKHGLSSSC